MALVKQPLNISFAQGLDLKTDPFQVQAGKFLALQNTIFTKGGLLQKRNGFGALSALPDASSTFVTTFNGSLTAIGNYLQSYSSAIGGWTNKGALNRVDLAVQPLIRSTTNQTQVDTAVASNGLICTVYTDVNNGVPTYKYAVADTSNGQNVIAPTVIPANSGGVITGSPRVFSLGRYFVIVFNNVISATNHLQYIAINTVNLAIGTNTDISSNYSPASTLAFDGVVANNTLFMGWNGNDGGGAVRVAFLTSTLVLSNPKVFAGSVATLMSLAADTTSSTPNIFVSFYNSATSSGSTLVVDQNLNTVHAPVTTITGEVACNLNSAAQNGTAQLFYEVVNAYGFDSSVPSHYIKTKTVTTGGTVTAPSAVMRSIGLASKAFIVAGLIYFLAAYASPYQPSYFLMDQNGNAVAKLAYSNGGGYVTAGLPSVSVNGNQASIPYQIKDSISAVNKNTNVPSGSQIAGIYSQTGLNLATFTVGANLSSSAEIAGNLNIGGGFLWSYDGSSPVENNFHVWPDTVEATWSATGGAMAAKPDGATNTNAYFYQATYEWSDNQGNIIRSAPSIPVAVTTTGTGTAGSVTINVPTLRLTYKISNPAKIVLYRWSVAQQTYFQVTSLSAPTMNSTSSDYVTIVDTLADASVLGNNILYTNGGVVENIAPPATSIMTLFQSRLFMVDSEDRNLIWFSKQVIENTPVEMSDLFTIYVAPTTSAQGSTGPITALAAMDDKLIIFKKNAIYYLNGLGPDNTGANNQFSDPVFITSTVGCSNQSSIVFMPNGIMFQSDKGIWLLGRDLSTNYIGAAVENFNSAAVQSALNIPGTNQVRFTLNNGLTLMYDYFFGQWGSFANVPAVSSTLFQGLHTYINSFGQVFQETPAKYLDGSNPVLISFTTAWFALAGLQGYQRAYFFDLLGKYLSPHKLQVQIAYNYNPAPSQQASITPGNFNAPYGGDSRYGLNNYGGSASLEQWRVNFQRQLCESFQITINEIYDPSFGGDAGAGCTLSGINLVYGVKKGFKPQSRANTAG